MDLYIPQPILAKALKEASSATSHRNSLAVLTCVLLSAVNGQLTITGTDLIHALQVSTCAQITEPGAIAVPAQRLAEFIGTIKKTEEIHLKVDQSTFTLHLTCTETTAQFKGILADEFPLVPQSNVENGIHIPAKELTKAIGLVDYAVSQDESREILTGIHVVYADAKLRFESADGFRMSVFDVAIADQEPFEGILPSRSMTALAQILKGVSETVKITTVNNKNTVIFETENYLLSTQLVAGTFPALDRVIPKSSATHVTASRHFLSDAIKRALIFGRDAYNRIVMDINAEKNEMAISAAAETGDGVTSIPATVQGPDVRIALNGTYIKALLKALDVPEVKFGFNRHTEPVLIAAIGEDAFLHVVMPMMLD